MNKNKYIAGGVVITLVAIGLFFGLTSDKDSINAQVASVIEVETSYNDFGDIDIFGGKVETIYMLKNMGQDDVTITSAVTSCMCTEGEIGDLRFGMHGNNGKTIIIPAGEEKALTAIYDPLAHGPEGTGKVTRELMLGTNSSETPEIRVKFDANVVKI